MIIYTKLKKPLKNTSLILSTNNKNIIGFLTKRTMNQ